MEVRETSLSLRIISWLRVSDSTFQGFIWELKSLYVCSMALRQNMFGFGVWDSIYSIKELSSKLISECLYHTEIRQWVMGLKCVVTSLDSESATPMLNDAILICHDLARLQKLVFAIVVLRASD